MAWLKVKSNVTGKIDTIADTAYENYYKNMGIYTIVKESNKEEEVPKVIEKKPMQEDTSVKPIKPIKPLKAKADESMINSEI